MSKITPEQLNKIRSELTKEFGVLAGGFNTIIKTSSNSPAGNIEIHSEGKEPLIEITFEDNGQESITIPNITLNKINAIIKAAKSK